MLLDQIPLPLDPRGLHVLLGALLGLVFGIAAQISRFCLRRAVAGDVAERRPAAGVWMAALAASILGAQGLVALGLASFDGHRWLSADLPLLALAGGGLAFGVGMVLTRGCVSRLSVLAGTGNLRAVTVLLVFAIVAHAMLKGVLAPLRTAITASSVPVPLGSLADLPGGALLWALLLAIPLAGLAARSGARPLHLALGAVIGLVAAAGWAGTSVLLQDDFDPLPVQSVAFTLTWAETLFWTIASTAIPASFGVGFALAVVGGAFLSAALRGELALQSFDTPAQTLRYAAGAALMGIGGVLAGGCTVGAGLAGTASLSVAAFVALGAMIAGALATRVALEGRRAPVAA